MCFGGIYRCPWRPEKLDPSKVSKAERQCSLRWSRVAWGVAQYWDRGKQSTFTMLQKWQGSLWGQ